jgi:hypothetical protein
VRKALRPLECVIDKSEARVVLDGIDRVSSSTRDAVREALAAAPPNLRVIITARLDTPGCPSGYTVELGPAPADSLRHYRFGRDIPVPAHAAILERASGHCHWLLTRLLADLIASDRALDFAELPRTVNEAYAKLFDRARSSESSDQFRLATHGSQVRASAIRAWAASVLTGTLNRFTEKFDGSRWGGRIGRELADRAGCHPDYHCVANPRAGMRLAYFEFFSQQGHDGVERRPRIAAHVVDRRRATAAHVGVLARQSSNQERQDRRLESNMPE